MRAGTASAAAARAAALRPRPATPLSADPVLHLLRRATFGPTPEAVTQARDIGIDAWIEAQLAPGKLADGAADAAVALFPTVAMTTSRIRASVPAGHWDAMLELGRATLARQIWSTRQLFEVMVDFWSNHLNVTCPDGHVWDVRTSYDKDVIRPFALGRFSDMLTASARSPAMLAYLNNNASTKRSVNENYGRELLELHTVGLGAGYTEADVRNSAYLMSGRTLDAGRQFVFDPAKHWTGAVNVLGFSADNTVAADGLAAGDAYLTYLARHPATAARIARKLAVRFVSDDPPSTLVDRLAQAYLDNGTAIVPVLRALFGSAEFWTAAGAKTRRPLEDLVATARVLGLTPGPDTLGSLRSLYWWVSQAGHAPLAWARPDGYPDTAPAWTSTNGTLFSWNVHWQLVNGYPGLTRQRLVGTVPATLGGYLDALAARLLFQPLLPAERAALLAFLGGTDATKVPGTDPAAHLVPLLLDSLAHGLR
ncbi:MAG: hypothetical protein V7603_31 [Micromonosporaceae bacterium]